MNEPPEDKPAEPEDRPGGPSQENLEEVLSTLEHMLRHRHVVSETQQGDEAPPPDADSLPLLKNVVIPGDPPAPLPREAEDEGPRDGYAEPLDPAPRHDDLLVRLVNELDIIIESCVDDALAAAKQELMVKMKNHLDIVLPEILEELERRRFDPDDGEDDRRRD